MANLIESLGYSLGKVHTGMIAYLCDLYNEGTKNPLQDFLGSLGVQVPNNPVAKREYQSIDLAIFDGDNHEPHILIEMKVDDHEHEKSHDGVKIGQTVRYAKTHPSCVSYIYITLGMGEFFGAPKESKFRWVGIREFLTSLESIKQKDQPIQDWLDSICKEVQLQNLVSQNDRSRLNEYRCGAWNIYFLGYIKKKFTERNVLASKDIDMTCYPYGRAPDTILNFGWTHYPFYLEINNNGYLNLKVNLESHESDDEKRQSINELLEEVTRSFPVDRYFPSKRSRLGASKTIASFNIGLCKTDNYLQFMTNQEETLDRLEEIVGWFYSRIHVRC